MKTILLFFSLILGIFLSFSKEIFAACAGGYSYFTCAYQSGTGLVCSSGSQPFHLCGCRVNDLNGVISCKKEVYDWCYDQQSCNWSITSVRNNPFCSKYGDCCGCSGKPRLIPLPTPKPKPIPTPILGCYQSCRTDSDCRNGLKCGYHVTVGKRVCLNPSCPLETDCRCDWQK